MIEVRAVARVYNPNPVPAKLREASLTLHLNGVRMTTSATPLEEVKPGSEGEVCVTALFDSGRVPEWWATHVRRGEKTAGRISLKLLFDAGGAEHLYVFEKDFHVETSLLKPLNRRGYRIFNVGPVILMLKSAEASWGEVTTEKTKITHRVVIYNPHVTPVPLSRVDYAIEANGVVVGRGAVKGPLILNAKEDNTLTLNLTINNLALSRWWRVHVGAGENTTFSIRVWLVVEAGNVEHKAILSEARGDFTTNLLATV